jgi:hypothetical protein
MSDGSWRICRLIGCVVALVTLFAEFGTAEQIASDMDPPTDARGLTPVRNLSKLPAELAILLGWHGDAKDRIADFDRDLGAPVQQRVDSWFVVAGTTDNYALVGIEERLSFVNSSAHFHANSFRLVGSQWIAGAEWILASRPHSVEEMTRMIQSPESQDLTASWQKQQHDYALGRRQAELAYRRPAKLRENNINDEEVRQIEAIVRSVIPGAILNISGVGKGCPCEEGPECTAQVWTVIHSHGVTQPLTLSDIDEHWLIGPVQQWYLDSAQLDRTNFPTYAAYATAREMLLNRFPSCATGPAKAH